jgi:hypothetical protein
MVCGDKKGRSRVTIDARVDMWNRKRVYIPLGNRCCKHHLSDGIFKEEACNMIKPGPSALMTGQMVALKENRHLQTMIMKYCLVYRERTLVRSWNYARNLSNEEGIGRMSLRHELLFYSTLNMFNLIQTIPQF